MPGIGKALTDAEKQRWQENTKIISDYEKLAAREADKIKSAGISVEKIHAKGQMTAYERIEYLVDAGTWCPLHTLYNPADNADGCTGVIDGLGKIAGHWAVIIAFDNKILAGAWIAGQAENILRVTDLAKKLNIPLVWVLNCSGVKLTEQEKVYAGARGNGATFFRHAELNQLGIPVLNAIFGTNPAGGGYHGISPTILIAHKDANIAVGGAGIVGGMNPTGRFDQGNALQIIEAMRNLRVKPPGRVETHFDETAFFREVHDTETGVLDGIKEYMRDIPAYSPAFFQVADEMEPVLPQEELYYLLQANPKMIYDSINVMARLVDSSEFMEYRPDYGPEVFTGITKIGGFPVGMIGNKQGFLPNYPDYGSGDNFGLGGKLYRQGLIKMNEFVTFCGRDKLPIIWLQDTLGIDVGDNAEKAELLGLGQSLVYSIEQAAMPMLCIVLRKGTAAAHYLMGGPQSTTTAITLGTALTEIYVMHSETAAVANYGRRLVKETKEGKSHDKTLEAMNAMVDDYYQKSRPVFCAQTGMIDEIVPLAKLRSYCVAFTGAYYQNPRSITPVHQMILPRIIKG
jgi:Acetyl-CoA carboxylase, carboxyltransferase component (subunits alpha and beta)